MRIAFSNDHAAAVERQPILEKIRRLGHEVVDFGSSSLEAVDYPHCAIPAILALVRGEVERAVLMCGSGIGMSIVANRFPGVRCALATDEFAAEMSRRHNDSNCLALRAREQTVSQNERIIEVWVSTEFEAGRHLRRVELIDAATAEILNQIEEGESRK